MLPEFISTVQLEKVRLQTLDLALCFLTQDWTSYLH